MSRTVYLLTQAERDLTRYFSYFAENAGLHTAQRFRGALDETFALLLDFPELGVVRPMTSRRLSRVRMWPARDFPDHLVFYEPVDDGIRIVRVIHTKQDYRRVL